MSTEHEQRLAELMAGNPRLTGWLTEMRGFERQAQGLVLIGLSPQETIEFFELDPIIHSDEHNPTTSNRYFLLRAKHDAARQADAAKNLDFLMGGDGEGGR